MSKLAELNYLPPGGPGTDETIRMMWRWEDLEDCGVRQATDPLIAEAYDNWLEFKVKMRVRTPERTEAEFDGLEMVEAWAEKKGCKLKHDRIRHDRRPVTKDEGRSAGGHSSAPGGPVVESTGKGSDGSSKGPPGYATTATGPMFDTLAEADAYLRALRGEPRPEPPPNAGPTLSAEELAVSRAYGKGTLDRASQGWDQRAARHPVLTALVGGGLFVAVIAGVVHLARA